MKLQAEAALLRRYADHAEKEAAEFRKQMQQKLDAASRARDAAYKMAPRGRPPKKRK